jgi:virginiamycin A acetyltransferase
MIDFILRIKKLFRYVLAKLVCYLCFSMTKLTRFVYVSELISLVPFRTGNLARYFFYKITLSECGENVTINFGSIISSQKCKFGSNIWIGTYNILGTVEVGDWVITAQGVHIPSGKEQHGISRTDIPIMQQPGNPKKIKLKGDIWVGANATILDDIGEGCVIGAGSVVSRPVPDWTIAVGNPAKVIRNRKENGNKD